ncbi:hypothetical protein AAES_135674 [Amazona aestiva]|uniref:Uncharacterized protein n=1 Tax=Amazona aestiva TaxID=12930 RepID=A0A0Q3P6K3_AMAAE|nr:hypothetical protein AAES_135674 [Amazona aestiva]
MNPPTTGKHPERAAALHKAPSLGRARVAAAGILSVGNVLNYLDRYTVAGEAVPDKKWDCLYCGSSKEKIENSVLNITNLKGNDPLQFS